MPIFTRLLLWPPGFLPRRSAAVAQVPPGPMSVQLPSPVTVVTPPAEPRSAAEPPELPHESLGERRSSALRKLFPMLFSMYARRSDLWQAIAVERFLSQATDIADLERRIRDVERRRQFHWSE
jgi:Protein of unknown function (DUF3563)